MKRYLIASAFVLLISSEAVFSNAGAQTDDLQKVQVNGAELAVRDVGQGEPVVLVHGTADDYRFWSGHLDELSKNHRVISYSRRYHAPNAPASADVEYNEKIHANDLVALIEELDLAPVHLVGSSYGASIAAHAAASRPELFRSVVLAEPTFYSMVAESPDPEVQASLKERTAKMELVKENLQAGNQLEAIHTFFNYVLNVPREKRPEPVVARWMENAPTLAVQVNPATPPPAFTCEDAKRITAPTLLVGGSDAIKPFPAILDELERCLPSAERVTIAGVGHSPAVKVQEFGQLVVDFVARH